MCTINGYKIKGNWNSMITTRVSFPEPVYNVLLEISKRKGQQFQGSEVRDMVIEQIKQTTGIDLLKIDITKTPTPEV